MANIGLSQPWYATYTATGNTITYGTAKCLAKAVSVNVTTEGKDPEVLYADNGPAESLALFGGGTVTLGIDHLELATAAELLGMTAPTTSAPQMVWKCDVVAPYVGLGFICKMVKGGSIKWRAIALYKVQFKVPDYSIDTQGETVSFQTPELEAEILRDDAAQPKWSAWEDCDTEAAALTAMKAMITTPN